jgi:2-iminobutanoate/2-iminopropanoate deaminase
MGGRDFDDTGAVPTAVGGPRPVDAPASSVPAMSKPLGPYSPVVRAGDFVIVSGQGGMADGALVDGGVSAETTQTMKNVEAQLASVGASLSDIVKTTCFLTDMENFAAFNEAYAAALGDHRPARSTVAVAGLPAGFLVEVEAWAYVPQ